MVNGSIRVADITGVCDCRVDDIAVTIVANLDLVHRSARQTAVDARLPTSHGVEISRTETEPVGLIGVHWSAEVHIVDLRTEVDFASSHKQSASHPVDEGVCQKGRSRRPVGAESDEKHHLLTTSIVVDHSGTAGRGRSIRARGE